MTARQKFFKEFNIIPHVFNCDELLHNLMKVILIRLGRVHFDYILTVDGERDLSCSFNVIVGYGNSMLECLMEVCIKLKEDIYDDVRSLFYAKFRE